MAPPALVLVHGGGLAADSWQLTVDEIHRRAPGLTVLAVDLPGRRGMPDNIPRTWILTRRDRALSVRSRHSSIAAVGGVQTLIEIDTCHCLMVSEPKRLAGILVERCQLYG